MTAGRRVFRFGLVVAVTAILFAWAGRTAWRKTHQLRGSFAAFESDSFHLSDYIDGPIRSMNEAILAHGLHHDSASRAEFLRQNAGLKARLHSRDTAPLMTRSEQEIVGQIQAALETYTAKGLNLMDETETKPGQKPLLERVEANAAPLFELCDKLTEVERVEIAGFMKDSHDSLAWLEGLLIASLVLLIAFASGVAFSANRELLAPLRHQVRQSRAVLERHEKLASLGTLAAGLAHEIRNPLTAINVRIHSLKRNLTSGSSEHEDAIVIDGEIKRLEAIVRAFLQFARPAEPTLVVVSADRLLTSVRALMGGQLAKAAIELALESPPDLWVRVDPQQVEQVLINLVQNAAESIEQNGTIRLRARSATARLSGSTKRVVILEVSDTGKGIPPEAQKRLFDPFFTTKEEGTGLGLCIAARIVQQQGGALEYTTQPGRGTTFSILLPEPDDHSNEPPSKDTIN